MTYEKLHNLWDIILGLQWSCDLVTIPIGDGTTVLLLRDYDMDTHTPRAYNRPDMVQDLEDYFGGNRRLVTGPYMSYILFRASNGHCYI